MNECLITPQHEKQISYWVSEKGKSTKWLNIKKIHSFLTVTNLKMSFLYFIVNILLLLILIFIYNIVMFSILFIY